MGNDSKTYALFTLVFSGNKTLATAFSMIIAVMIFSSGFSGITVFSRIAYSMARDGAFPCSGYLKELDPKTKVPLRIIFFLFILTSLLSMLPLVSHDAFTAILQISTFSIQLCYAIPIYLRLTHSRETFE